MFYKLLKSYARLAIHLYCRRIVINRPEWLKARGPLLIAANHPNSFLDGVILTTLFDEPVYSLARGDVFRHPRINKALRSLQLLPVYRTSEGVENLEHNYTTFAACQDAFRKNGIVLIFSEGRCENEWHLRPLKKGTARLATSSWAQGIPLTVVPLAFNYSSFARFGKEVHLSFGEPIHASVTRPGFPQGKQLLDFNERLQHELAPRVYEIAPGDQIERKKRFGIHVTAATYLLALPALLGWIFHLPLFALVKLTTHLRFQRSGHYDSVQTAMLLLAYPFYLLLIILLAWPFLHAWSLLVLLILPLTARAALLVKYDLDW